MGSIWGIYTYIVMMREGDEEGDGGGGVKEGSVVREGVEFERRRR